MDDSVSSVSMTYYEPDGRITGVLVCGVESASANDDGLWIEGAGNLRTQYVLDGQIVDRPAQATQLTGATLVDLPVPCTVTVNDTEYPCDEPTAQLEFDQPGTYQIKVTAWPHLDKEFTYENPGQV